MAQAMISCGVCDRYFPSNEALKQHNRDSPVHAPTFDCDDCDRSFKSDEALQQHFHDSPIHAPKFGCKRRTRSLKGNGALRNQQRVGKARTTSKSDASIQAFTASGAIEYIGVAPSLVKPVYRIAVRLRRQRPSVQDIIRASKTSLESPIVAALWTAAERLNSLDESTEDAQRRAALQRQRATRAKIAEDTFTEVLAFKGLIFSRESEQRSAAEALGERAAHTPDIKFTSPVIICGVECCWLEFKDYFGFPANPFVARSEKKQFRKYVTALGPGAVVYSLGFECGYPRIEGVRVFRAREVLLSIGVE